MTTNERKESGANPHATFCHFSHLVTCQICHKSLFLLLLSDHAISWVWEAPYSLLSRFLDYLFVFCYCISRNSHKKTLLVFSATNFASVILVSALLHEKDLVSRDFLACY